MKLIKSAANSTLMLSMCLIMLVSQHLSAQTNNAEISEVRTWDGIVGSTSASGWFLSRGKALVKRSGNTLTVVFINEQGVTTQTYRGKLRGNRWSGERDVEGSDNQGEPLEGTLNSIKASSNVTETLMLTNYWTFAAFTRTYKATPGGNK